MGNQHNFGGVWTLIKLAVLKKYLSAFTAALSKQSFRLIYIDGFAGTGRCNVKIYGESVSVDGSARIALQASPSFHHYCFIELSSKKIAELQTLAKENPRQSVEIIQDDANAALQALCKKYDWKETRAVLFLDPFGLEVEWKTLKAIADTQAIDVWYFFPYAGLYRQAAKKAENIGGDKKAAITRVLGTDEWKNVFYKSSEQANLFGKESDTRDASHGDMLKYVSKRLKGVFPAVLAPKIFYQSGDSNAPKGAPLFALYFAASNPNQKAYRLAIKIAKDVINTL